MSYPLLHQHLPAEQQPCGAATWFAVLAQRCAGRLTLLPLALLLLTLAPVRCRLVDPADAPDAITNLRFSPSAFDSFSRNSELRYTLKAPLRVTAEIVRSDPAGGNQLVTTLFTDLWETGGTHAHTWLGQTDQGRFAPAGEYRGVVRVGSQAYETTVRVFHF